MSPPKKRKRNTNCSLNECVLDIFEDINKSLCLNRRIKSSEAVTCKGNQTEDTNKRELEASQSSHASETTRPGISKGALERAIRLLRDDKLPKKGKEHSKDKFSRTCSEGYDQMYDMVHWESSSYRAKGVRHLILNREWERLKEMIKLFMTHHKYYKNYVKELTYLYHLINADTLDPSQVEEYFNLSFSTSGKSAMREFDIWFHGNYY